MHDEDADYEINARHDYLQEAYGAEAKQLDEQNANERQCFGCGMPITAPDVTCGAHQCDRDYADWQRGQDELAAEDEVERLAAQQYPEYLSPTSPYYADAQRTIQGRYLGALHRAAQDDDGAPF